MSCVQDVMGVITRSANDFDAVCMATALHRLANLNLSETARKLLNEKVEFVRLKKLICEHFQHMSGFGSCFLGFCHSRCVHVS